ncbi:MAG TPA: hypothetical protein DCG75_04700 [Bacteroidales bacterium]|nr:hypothetical protein [Bacteroidales bacterium]
MSFNDIIYNYKESKKLRKMKFTSDQLGIMNRYVREKENWNKHIQESKDFILQSANSKEKGKVVILGSGWLLDVPLQELSEMFLEVLLIDIVHPKRVVKKISKYSNVTLLKADITGGMIDYIYENPNKKEKLLVPIHPFSFNLPENTDFVISLNIMCQLHIILVDYLKNISIFSDKELKEFDKNIQIAHLKILPEKKTCLITDIEEEILTKDDQTIGVNPLIHVDLPVGNFSKVWQWKFDSKMTYRDDYKTFFNTQAIDF